MLNEIETTIKEKFEEYGKPILADLEVLAKKYGPWIVAGLVVVYLWKKFKK